MKLYTPSRIQRRLGERMFLKAERDTTSKSAMVRRAYPPGARGKTARRSRQSDFGTALQEKQKIRFLYGLSDAALKRCVNEAERTSNKTRAQAFTEHLERRLDNVVYRLGFAASRRIARQLVSHGHILCNGRRVRIASAVVRRGDRIQVRPASLGTPPFAGLPIRLKKYQPPEWLTINAEEASGEVRRLPGEADTLITSNLNKVIEFYSR